ncbi:MAG: OmpA family protein [Bdellovibrionales bacterium]|nr:OmpA family protein [Bdellovibrionales bacterium]
MAFDPLAGPGDEAEGWLTSYADLMTLIACFFILMVSFADFSKKDEFMIKTRAIAKHFNKDKFLTSEMRLRYLEQELAKHPELKTKTKISLKDSELIVIFSGSILFDEGQYLIPPESLKTLDSLIDIIKTENSEYRILIEGYADDLSGKNPFKNTWTLSSARSSSVAERFEYFGFIKENITAIGKGDTFKLVESNDKFGNRVEANARINRRVVVKILEPIYKKKIKLGLGVYFEDAEENR